MEPQRNTRLFSRSLPDRGSSVRMGRRAGIRLETTKKLRERDTLRSKIGTENAGRCSHSELPIAKNQSPENPIPKKFRERNCEVQSTPGSSSVHRRPAVSNRRLLNTRATRVTFVIARIRVSLINILNPNPKSMLRSPDSPMLPPVHDWS